MLGLQYDLAVAAMRVFNLVCLILLIGHWNGCLQFLVPMINNFPNDSWIVIDKLMVGGDRNLSYYIILQSQTKEITPGGGATRPLPKNGGAEELRGDPTVAPHL